MLIVRCGTINARAIVIWTDGDRAGVKFVHALSDAELNEQVFRCAALESRRRIGAVCPRERETGMLSAALPDTGQR